jgi:hypothetical protein
MFIAPGIGILAIVCAIVSHFRTRRKLLAKISLVLGILTTIIWTVLLLLFTLFSELAEPALSVTVYNQTNQSLRILLQNEVFLAEIAPGVRLDFETSAIYPSNSVAANDAAGNKVYSANWTRDDLDWGKKPMKYSVIFPPGTPEPSTSYGIRVENRTRNNLMIFANGSFEGEITHYATISWLGDTDIPIYNLTASRQFDWNVVYSKTFTRPLFGNYRVTWTIYSPPETTK